MKADCAYQESLPISKKWEDARFGLEKKMFHEPACPASPKGAPVHFALRAPQVEKNASGWDLTYRSTKLHLSLGRVAFAPTEKVYSYLPTPYGYQVRSFDSLSRMRDRNLVTILNVGRARSRVSASGNERQFLIVEYERLVAREMSQGLNVEDAHMLREVERKLDELDSREEIAVQALSSYRKEISRLHELNEVAERLKELL
jgi:hypothetical protein